MADDDDDDDVPGICHSLLSCVKVESGQKCFLMSYN